MQKQKHCTVSKIKLIKKISMSTSIDELKQFNVHPARIYTLLISIKHLNKNKG